MSKCEEIAPNGEKRYVRRYVRRDDQGQTMTLFAIAEPEGPYQAALARWCGGEHDPHTVELLSQSSGREP
jgi:uncharacterized protein (DUF1810 family)